MNDRDFSKQGGWWRGEEEEPERSIRVRLAIPGDVKYVVYDLSHINGIIFYGFSSKKIIQNRFAAINFRMEYFFRFEKPFQIGALFLCRSFLSFLELIDKTIAGIGFRQNEGTTRSRLAHHWTMQVAGLSEAIFRPAILYF